MTKKLNKQQVTDLLNDAKFAADDGTVKVKALKSAAICPLCPEKEDRDIIDIGEPVVKLSKHHFHARHFKTDVVVVRVK